MMDLSLWIAAVFTRFAFNLTALYQNVCVRAASHFHSLLRGEWMGFAPLSHVPCAAFIADAPLGSPRMRAIADVFVESRACHV